MARVALIAGSSNDKKYLDEAIKVLEEFGIDYDVKVLSAHRTPKLIEPYIREFEDNGGEVIVAFAGYAAHLAGVIASYTILPVIGVPLATSSLSGMDALLSMVQMPRGVPVATVAVNGAANGALLAVEILSLKDPALKDKLIDYRKKMEESVVEANKNLL